MPEETKKKILNLNNLQQSFEFLTAQKIQLESTLRDTELAIEELGKINQDDVVYKSIGGILVKSEKNKLLDEKKNLKKTLEMRVTTIKQKESRVKGEIERIRNSLTADFQNKNT
ncbi:MAG: prefoldin subunit beta [Promethearchaeota archaeon]